MQPVAINQRLIAKQLNLSPATVSKSFRNHPDIKPETRAMVLDLASRMGYRTNFGARGAKKGNTRPQSVGVLFYDDGGVPEYDTSGRGYLTGLSEAAALHNASLVIHRFGPDAKQILDPARQPPALRSGMLEGLVLIHRIDPDCVRALAIALPTVLLTHSVPNVRADLVNSDHISGIAKLMDHLYGLGHRRIGFVGRHRNLTYSQARFGSYTQSLCRLNLEHRPNWLISVFDDGDIDQHANLALAAMQDGVTAFICANDYVGYELCQRLIERGVRIPKDVSVTGFDAMAPMHGCLALTTLRVPFAEMGAAALMQLLSRIQRASLPALQTLFDCELVNGQTTGPVKT